MAQSPEAAWLGRRACGRLPPLSPLAALCFLVPSDKLALARWEAPGTGPHCGCWGTNWDSASESFGLGDWGPQLCAWVRWGRTVMAMGPQLTGAGGSGQEPRSGQHGLHSSPRPRCGRRDPSPGHAGRGGQAAGQSTIPLSSPRAASAPSPIPFPKDRRCGKSLPAVSAPSGHSCVPVSAGHPGITVSLQPCPGQACGPSAVCGGKDQCPPQPRLAQALVVQVRRGPRAGLLWAGLDRAGGSWVPRGWLMPSWWPWASTALGVR